MRKTLFIIVSALTLAGCSNGPSDPLFDAPLGERTVCTAVNPVKGNDVLSVVPFAPIWIFPRRSMNCVTQGGVWK